MDHIFKVKLNGMAAQSGYTGHTIAFEHRGRYEINYFNEIEY